MKKIVLLVAFSLTILFSYAQAQQEKSGHYKAAEDLMAAMNMPQTLDASIPQMVEMQVKGNPILVAKQEAFTAFMMKHSSWKALGAQYIKIYMEEYTESDLKELAAFYRTDLGKKLAAKQIGLSIKAGQLGQNVVQANMAELMQIMQ